MAGLGERGQEKEGVDKDENWPKAGTSNEGLKWGMNRWTDGWTLAEK